MKRAVTSKWGEVYTGPSRARALTPASKKLFPNLCDLLNFVVERHNVYLKRAAGQPWPWTSDPKLRAFRFTNVYRELDKETEWIFLNWLAQVDEVWFASLVARHINWHPTLMWLPHPDPWQPEEFLKQMQVVAENNDKVFSAAYMINQTIPGGKGLSKAGYLERYLFSPAWKQREILRPRPREQLWEFHERLMTMRGVGSFIAAQIVADTKHFDPNINHAVDWHTWAAIGPGSARGMRMLRGEPPDQRWDEREWHSLLQILQVELNKRLPPGWPDLDAQNVQNCLCEFSKYVRGYSRQRFFPPHPQGELL